ncbi:MAG: histidine phosphatase family protein [Candidatus Thorarchaeota archaeon]
MNDDQVWLREEWLESARKLAKWASLTPSDSRVLLLVRHSHRETIEDHTAQLSTELTSLGCQMSTEFGRRIPSDRITRLFFSFVSRCFQTAEEISKGLRSNNAKIEEFDTLAILATPEIRDQSVWNELQPDGKNITDFVNRWAESEFGEKIEPIEEYEVRLKRDLIERLKDDKASALHIHVTHDLALMAAKRIFLERPVEWSDREPYLGGLGIVMNNGSSMLYIASSGREYHL